MNKFKLSAIMLILGACEQPPSVQPQQSSQPQTAKITTNANCKNLHKVTDIDDLLYQMYTNIDSYCLFEMPTAELERTWGVFILTSDEPDFDKLREKYEKEEPFYITKVWDYVNNDRNIFSMNIHSTSLNPYFGGNIARGLFPELLPKPKIKHHYQKLKDEPIDIHGSGIPPVQPKNIYQANTLYFWKNSHLFKSEDYPVLFIETSPLSISGTMPSKIILQQKLNSFYFSQERF